MTTESECLFCSMASGAFQVDMLHKDERVFAIRDINPRAPVHFMVIPKQHIPSARALTPADGPLLGHMVSVANQLAVREGISERGYRLAFNVGEYGGQTIFHLHMHVLGGRQLGAEG
ncbi:MAG TPA: histidine triad nucleotide-binding protein [Dehalococcoidia bacterium]|nr:histidine triad nucleotide-binding protein [Dehalococcoidia bacterium]